MKLFVTVSALLSAASAAAVLPYAGLPYAYGNGLPLTYSGLTYAAGVPALTYAVAPAAAATVAVEAEKVEAPATTITYAAPTLTYAAAAAPAYTYAAAAAPAALPVTTYAAAYAAPAYSPGSQFHAQDEFGNLNYGYANINSAKQEAGNTYGGVSGAYSYVDAEGKLQQVTYVADAAGFRTADSRLPVAPVDTGVAPTFNPEPLVAPVFEGVAPVAPEDTPEVAAARAAHLEAVAAAEAVQTVERRRREADPAILYGSSTVLSAPTPLIHNAPLAYSAYPYGGYAGLPYAAGFPYSGLPYYG